MSPLPIGADTYVTLSYTLFDEHGEAVDRATASDPLRYVHGYAQIVPGLERRLEGLCAGEKRSFSIEPAEAFGDRDDEGVFEVDRSDFPDSEKLVSGDEFVAEGPDGEPISMRVLEVLPEALVVDTNHPLAGQTVRFDVEVSDVRSATDDEIAQAQADLEQRIADEHAGCDHDHDHDHGHAHGHEHLVQISRKV